MGMFTNQYNEMGQEYFHGSKIENSALGRIDGRGVGCARKNWILGWLARILFDIAMENGPFLDDTHGDLPIRTGASGRSFHGRFWNPPSQLMKDVAMGAANAGVDLARLVTCCKPFLSKIFCQPMENILLWIMFL